MSEEEGALRPRVLFAGGGTGGHVYPAIAIADALRALIPEVVIAFAGTQERLEWTAVPKAGYPIHPITVSGFHRKQMLRNLTFPFKLAQGLKQSWSLVGSFDPDVVVGTGGYVSGPVLWMAGLRGRTTVLQEQNAYAGVTNKLLAKRATRIHIAFDAAKAYFPEDKCRLSGNPTRPELRSADAAEGRRHFDLPKGAQVLFVFGGSLGSHALNGILKKQVHALLEHPNLYIIWQTGKRYFDRLQIPELKHERLRMLKYVDRMDLAYAVADLALCRSGAISCSELMVTGTPSVLVPSPNVAEDHQTSNARAMVDGGAAVLLKEPDMDAELVETIHRVLNTPETLNQMAEAAHRMARPQAADVIAQDILTLAREAGRHPNA